MMFDDFCYTNESIGEMEKNGWTIKEGIGGPGPAGCGWLRSQICFMDDPEIKGNTLLRLMATTDGTREGSVQSEIFRQTEYFEGTYATRIKFIDKPLTGEAGDLVNETFFLISPLDYDNDPNYSECDFEYLINGGWGVSETAMWNTTWKTYRPDPWEADNIYSFDPKHYDGWHILVCTVFRGKVDYTIDGVLKASHGERFFPRRPMSINYNIWFLQDGLAPKHTVRTYAQDIDWVFHIKDEALTTEQVLEMVSGLRGNGIKRVGTANLP